LSSAVSPTCLEGIKMLPRINAVMRISQDIELRYLPSGAAVAKLNLVSSSKYKTATGEQKEETCFIEGAVFGKPAEVINQYCKKGSKLYIMGDLKLDTWQDQNGQKRSKHTIKIDSFEFLDSKPQEQPQYAPPKVEIVPPAVGRNQPYDDGEIPF